MVTVTEKAAMKAQAVAKKEGKEARLRLGVRGGGCDGLSYFFEFCEAPLPKDQVWEVHGLQVVCDAKSAEILAETVFDFDSNLLKGGFRFYNPKAKKSCSCGESFSII